MGNLGILDLIRINLSLLLNNYLKSGNTVTDEYRFL